MPRSALSALAAVTVLFAPVLTPNHAAAQYGPFGQYAQFGPDACQPGYVWREAVPGDHVCVWPWVRGQTALNNAEGPALAYPDGTCVEGFVWREAFPGDHVCVRPWIRERAAWDNRETAYRRVSW